MHGWRLFSGHVFRIPRQSVKFYLNKGSGDSENHVQVNDLRGTRSRSVTWQSPVAEEKNTARERKRLTFIGRRGGIGLGEGLHEELGIDRGNRHPSFVPRKIAPPLHSELVDQSSKNQITAEDGQHGS